jgi:hypothetical protein
LSEGQQKQKQKKEEKKEKQARASFLFIYFYFFLFIAAPAPSSFQGIGIQLLVCPSPSRSARHTRSGSSFAFSLISSTRALLCYRPVNEEEREREKARERKRKKERKETRTGETLFQETRDTSKKPKKQHAISSPRHRRHAITGFVVPSTRLSTNQSIVTPFADYPRGWRVQKKKSPGSSPSPRIASHLASRISQG